MLTFYNYGNNKKRYCHIFIENQAITEVGEKNNL